MRQLGGKEEEKNKVERIMSIVAVCILQRDATIMHLTVSGRLDERPEISSAYFLRIVLLVSTAISTFAYPGRV